MNKNIYVKFEIITDKDECQNCDFGKNIDSNGNGQCLCHNHIKNQFICGKGTNERLQFRIIDSNKK